LKDHRVLSSVSIRLRSPRVSAACYGVDVSGLRVRLLQDHLRQRASSPGAESLTLQLVQKIEDASVKGLRSVQIRQMSGLRQG
jgi:hypothetical protein